MFDSFFFVSNVVTKLARWIIDISKKFFFFFNVLCNEMSQKTNAFVNSTKLLLFWQKNFVVGINIIYILRL